MFDNDYFTDKELSCRCCGKNHFSDDTLHRLIRVRERFNKPTVINSGYRCPAHDARSNATMTHATGQAVDVSVALDRAYELLQIMRRWGKTELTPNQQHALMEPSPCDHRHQRGRCVSEELACSEYLHWQVSGKVREWDRNPTSKLSHKIFMAEQ